MRTITTLSLITGIIVSLSNHATASDTPRYQDVIKQYPSAALSKQQVESARMQGKCLVELKEINFRRASVFDPVAEWTSARTSPLLERHDPCEVLIMLEVARTQMQAKEKNARR